MKKQNPILGLAFSGIVLFLVDWLIAQGINHIILKDAHDAWVNGAALTVAAVQLVGLAILAALPGRFSKVSIAVITALLAGYLFWALLPV